MAQMVSRGGPDPVTTGVLTVAELLNRNAPAAAKPKTDDASGVTVGSLLRREGRTQKIERPEKPGKEAAGKKAADKKAKETTNPHAAAHRRVLVRRGAIAAGALLAASSVVGGVVLTNNTASPTPTSKQDPLADPGYPGEGRLDPSSDPAPTAPAAVVDTGPAQGNSLDPGIAPPKEWTPVAFPSVDNGAKDKADDSSGSSNSGHNTTKSDDDDKSTKSSSGSQEKDSDSDKSKSAAAGDESTKDESAKTMSTTSDEDNEKNSAPQQSDDSDSGSSSNDEDNDGPVGGLLKSVGKTASGLLGG